METIHIGNVLFASFIIPKPGNEVFKFHSANTTGSFATLFPSNELRAPSSGAPSLRAFAFPPRGTRLQHPRWGSCSWGLQRLPEVLKKGVNGAPLGAVAEKMH